MTQTNINDVQDQVRKFWSSMWMDELKAATLLASLVNKDYDGEIKKTGDQVRVTQWNRATAQRKTVGAGHDTFVTGKLSKSYVDIKADQVISAGYEFDDLVELQSQVGEADSPIRKGLIEAYEIELNNYLYSLVNPESPDHSISGVSDFNASQLGAVRVLAAQAKWKKEGGWWALLDPQYNQDILNAVTMTSQDYAPGEAPVIGGQITNRRFNFNILEDNSSEMSQISPTEATADLGLFFHPDFLHLVQQLVPEFQISSLHAQKKFGYVISVRAVVGAKLGIDGDKKHIVVYNS